MNTLYLVEFRFFLLPVLMQVFFAIITLFISYQAFKVFRITKHPQSKSMSAFFFLIFISYVVQATINFLNVMKINPDIYVVFGIHPLSVFHNQGLYFHILFMTFGLAFLMFTVFKSKESSLLWYFVLTSVLVFFLSSNKLIGFFMLTVLYLAFLSYHYMLNYKKRKKIGPLLVALAFVSMLIGHLGFLFLTKSTLFYAIGHSFSFVGYLLLLVNYHIIKK